MAAEIGRLPQVEVVMPTKIVMSECKATADLVAVHGVDKDLFQAFRHYELTAGSMEDFHKEDSAALVGIEIAQRYAWKLGEHVSLAKLAGVSFTIRGFFHTGGTAHDSLILVDRTYLQLAVEAKGKSNQFHIKLREAVEPDLAANTIDGLNLPVATRTLTEKSFISSVLEDTKDVVFFSRIVAALTLAVLLIAVANAISMSARDRIQEIGVMRTLGFQRSRILGIVLCESLLISIAGGALGLLVSWIAMDIAHVGIAVCGYTVSLAFDRELLMNTGVIVIFLGLAAGIVPAVASSRLSVVESLRHVD
jgi:putative ABC transport system permease protein